MKKIAVILANGFEEVEALTVVDMLRRLQLTCDMIGFEKEVEGSHGIIVKADRLLSDTFEGYDAIVLPGGLPGATNLRDSEKVIELVKKMNEEGKLVAAICAAPMVLDRAGVLKGKKCTSYPGVGEKFEGCEYVEDFVVKDGNILTSRGPATAFAFAFSIAEELGVCTKALRDGTLYSRVVK